MDEWYRVEAPSIPAEDRSGELGQRLLRLLERQAERDLRWLRREAGERELGDCDFDFLLQGPPRYQGHPYVIMHQVGDCALQFAVLALFHPDKERCGLPREALRTIALGLIRALCATHPVAPEHHLHGVTWDRFDCLRHDFVVGLAAWLLWNELDERTRLLLGRMLEHDADSWCDGPAPAQLHGDTQAESNAWSSSGMALAYCLLKRHPRRSAWGEKANELMISAYATEADVTSDRVVDGKPLREWLTGPNAFPDHTVENHGIIHGDYLAAISEQVRTAIAYRLAGEPIPEAVLFNAAPVFDRLMVLGLPDGAHLYMQGSDYIARRLDSFYQACNVVPLAPGPLRSAAFLRALDSVEHMEAKRPEVPISGWLGFNFDLGIHWGTIENYLVRRLFGEGAPPLPDGEVNAALAGVHVAEPARYAVHRTPTTLSSFSWHTTDDASQVMGLTMPLDHDMLVSPIPVGSMVGRIDVAGVEGAPDRLIWHHVNEAAGGLAIALAVERCGGRVTQHSAFVSLPDGTAVYLEERVAAEEVTVTSATSGNVAIYDDTRGPYQQAERRYLAANGPITPQAGATFAGNWINIDDRLGYIALGAEGFTLRRADDYMHSAYGQQYRLGLLSFIPRMTTSAAGGQRLSAFALVVCCNQTSEATAKLAGELRDAELPHELRLGARVIYANFATGDCGWR